MFRTILTKSLRDYRWAILGWGLGLGLIVYAQYATFAATLGASPAQVQKLVQQFEFFGEAARVDTPGGFVTFKIMGVLPVILGIWTVLAGARLTRGEEESGALDIVLSTPRSRRAVIRQKLLALATAVALISLLIAVWILAGMARAGVTVNAGAALTAALSGGLAALFFGALALLLAQVMSRAAAAGTAGGLMALAFVLEGTGRALHNAAVLRHLSPLFLYDQNLPLVPGSAIHVAPLLLLAALTVLLAGAAVPLFVRRDIGRSALADLASRDRRPVPAGQIMARERRDLWVRGVGRQAMRRQSGIVFWWIVALALYAGYFVTVARSSEHQFQQLLGNSSFAKAVFSGTNIGTNAGFLSALIFNYLQLLVALFAGILAARWSADLDAGRLELVVSTPAPRSRVLLARYAAPAAAACLAAGAVWLAIVLTAGISGFPVNPGHVAAASAGLVPLALITASLVVALSGIIPRAAILGIMAGFLAASYLIAVLRTLLGLPGWVVDLSIFHQYGTPLLTGLNWISVAGLLVAAAILLGLGAWQFAARDLDRGTAGS